MLWQLRREIAATTPPRKTILSGVSRAGVCSRIVWQSRVACITLPMCLRFAATIRARDGRWAKRRIFSKNSVIAAAPLGRLTSLAILRANRLIWRQHGNCINVPFLYFEKQETLGVPRDL